MRPRDLAIVAAIGVLAAVAAADAFRSRGAEPGPEATTAPTQTGPETPTASFDRVPAPGAILYLDEHCVLHEVDVASGRELPLPRTETGCELWAAPRGERVAFTLPDPEGEFRLTQFLSLNRPLDPIGSAPDTVYVVWSPDGQAAGWCDRDGRGFLLEVGEPQARRIRGCPVAIAPNGFPVFRDPRGIRFGSQAIATDSFATTVSFGDDSVTFVLGDRIERRSAGGVSQAPVPPDLSGRGPLVAPDGCGALYPVGGARIRIVDICLPGELHDLAGTGAAWAPNSEWIATVTEDEIVFNHLGRSDVTRWPVRAHAIQWIG